MSALQQTNAVILENLRRQRRAHEARRRAALPIRAIDTLLADLEELHLAGRKRVPASMEARFSALNEHLPEEARRELRSRVTIVHLMDELYEMQNHLLSRRAGARGGMVDDGPDTELTGRTGGLPRAS